MDRLACVDVPALPLQLLLLEHPEWAGMPAAVVDEDKPQGLIRWVNAKAREAGVWPGLRYGPALSLAPTLRAGTIDEATVRQGVDTLFNRLLSFSPEIEPSSREPGVFWLDAGGLEHLFASSEAWAHALRADLKRAGFVAAVVVGFRRFGTYATARALSGKQAHVFARPEEEDEAVRRVPLRLVGLPPATRDALAKLGVHHVGELLGLPAHGLAKRFGPEALELHRFASGDLEVPLSPAPVEAPLIARVTLDYRESSAERLVFIIKPLVDQLLYGLGLRGRALTELQLQLVLDEAPERLELIRTAEPTLSSVTVMELVRLRLEATPFEAPAVGVAVTATAVPATPEQLRVFAEQPKRDPAAAARAFARLRAAFGREDVVATAVMRERHAPDGCFDWAPLWGLVPPHPQPEGTPTLVRRLLTPAEALPAWQPGKQLWGPYRLAGGWWRQEVQRDYYFAELPAGELWWVYHDVLRRRWRRQGEIS